MDGCSRGNHNAGISFGLDLRQFIPIDKGDFELQGPLLDGWCRSWMRSSYSSPLQPEGWFYDAHNPGIHLWAPPPAAALIALKQLAQSQQKQPEAVTHVFICQRLLWDKEWRRCFEKEMDLWFFIESSSNCNSVQPRLMFEPLRVGISFTMHRQKPWLVRGL